MSLEQLPSGVPLSSIPLAVNPDGSPPNFTDPISLAPTVMAVGVTFASIATIFVMVKLVANIASKRGLWIDDGFSVLALLMAHGYTGLVISLHKNQVHAWDLPLSALTESYFKKTTAVGLLYGIEAFAAKTATLLVLLRILNPERSFRIQAYIGISLVSIIHLSAIPVWAAYCTPLKGQRWDLAMIESRCANPSRLHTLIIAVLGTVLDIYIWLIPLPLVFGLHLPLKKKLGVAIVFMVGILVILASAVALYYRVLMYRGQDISWNFANATICGHAELYVIIMVGCAPGVAAFWRRFVADSSLLASIHLRFTSRGTENRSEIVSADARKASYPEVKRSQESMSLRYMASNDTQRLNP